MKTCIALLALFAAPIVLPAEEARSPYQGEESREIKALSSSEIDDLLAGEGMGFAKAAELNGYPGPAHVLALAEELGLDEGQLAATRDVERGMRAGAIETGRELVAAERALDRLFAERTVTTETLEAAVEDIAGLRAELRRIHLDAHLRQAALLRPAQVRDYARLRGYAGHRRAERHH